MEIISLIVGLIIGIILAYIIFYLFNKSKTVPKNEHDVVALKLNENNTILKVNEEKINILLADNKNLTNKLYEKENNISQLLEKSTILDTQLKSSTTKISELFQQLIVEQAISKTQQNEINEHKQKIAELTVTNNSVADNLSEQNKQNEKQKEQIEELNTKLANIMSQVSKLNVENSSLSEKLANQKIEIIEIQKTAHLQFEKIANQLLEEKTSKFTETNKVNIEVLLNPLKDDINKFKTKVEETYDKESKERFSLAEKVKDLIEQTNKVSAEANNLAVALKGKPQKRGNWGEMILERILETSGLTKDREYFIQQSIKNEEGNTLRPDVKIILPNNRVVMIDSKVSLIAYDNFIATENTEEQKKYLAEHMKSVHTHIEQLSSKKYDDFETSLDATMMFIPIEPAYLLAIQGDTELLFNAYSKRILLVSPTTLIACIKLFSDLWRWESQNKNAKDIVRRGELIYDKAVGFVKTFEKIGESIRTTQDKYDEALKQLAEGKGNLISQANQMKKLGLKSDKTMPPNLLSMDIDDMDIYTEE